MVTDNPIGRAVVAIAEVAGRRTTLLADEDVEQTPVQWLAANPLEEADAFVLCDHDTPGMEELLRAALDGRGGLRRDDGQPASRREASSTRWRPSCRPTTLARLHVPAGLNTGGKAPGEIALSVVAEIVAVSYGRPGGPMKAPLSAGSTPGSTPTRLRVDPATAARVSGGQVGGLGGEPGDPRPSRGRAGRRRE